MGLTASCYHNTYTYARYDDRYEEIMERSWNAEKGFFAQSYEDLEVLDSAVLVMPLVFSINGKPSCFIYVP